MYSNYDDVLAQLTGAGLKVDLLEMGKLRRCKVEGDTEKRGWYHLHEIRLSNGDDLIVGSYGAWHGLVNNATKVELKGTDLSAEQRSSLRNRLAEDKRRAEFARKADAERAAAKAKAAWNKCSDDGDCKYLHRKNVLAHGVRFSPQGSVVIPMLDITGKIHGLQVIRGKQTGQRKRLDKEFWPAGLTKKGHFHLIGMPDKIILVAEGYATAASLFEATGLCVAVAFDASNLCPVANALHARYKQANILICADDDAFSEGNPGVTCASAAAMEVGGAFAVPQFADAAARTAAFEAKGQKLSDFNDLHTLEGLHVVRVQIEGRITALGWRESKTLAAKTVGEGDTTEQSRPRSIGDVDELMERFTMVYGVEPTAFDHLKHMHISLASVRELTMTSYIYREWSESPDRKISYLENVGFDPTGRDTSIECNLWAGWPATPKAGSCEHLLDLLRYMCASDSNPEILYQWVLRWLAYPIQHPGAKMKTCLMVHGPQGTGKNMFFEAIMAIYGKYGNVIDQGAIEDKFNDWASRKLFLIADEVIARADLYHIKGKLKALITGGKIRINPKGFTEHDERNHINFVFLSNESLPVILEDDDRRFAVIWTPPKLSPDFYMDTQAEIDAGGIAALHHYLLHLDLGDMTNATNPPMTEAKQELIDLSSDSPNRFIRAFEDGDVEGFPGKGRPALLSPMLSIDLFDLYQSWCLDLGIKVLNQPRFANAIMRKNGATTERKRYDTSIGTKGPSAITRLPGGHELPAGQSEADWLGYRIEVFRTALKDFKGRKFPS